MGQPSWAAREPHPALRPFVRRYIGYTQHDVTLPVHRGLPSGTITLVISLAGPMRMLDGPGSPATMQAAVGGLHLGPVLIAQDSFQHGLHVELNPIGLRALLGVPAAELTSDIVDLADLPTSWARVLPDRLAGLPDWPSRFALLDTELARTLRPVTLVTEVQWAWRRMAAGHGTAPVAELADEIGWSRRHFTARFGREVGLAPKQVARLMRFERAGALLRRGPRPLAEVALDAGYYDQAHLTNEWRAMAGCTPSEWIREELPFLQDVATGPDADSGP
ncbi:helix-turn-helix transcriptional regulator [Labedaea rhizosphaerae]|uniref:AraC family transcriptional regulator n=1 Tax=Labedaea rhizosphaerae TaxID=598644 RepID=A0A4R6SHY7_LABRH|nr:helix-turn-helix domain-containing protein [Labedaea rhizosphaerae]TDQ01435.1 AraC family transcriptional regulator [Labedaea rhizosphaerae]